MSYHFNFENIALFCEKTPHMRVKTFVFFPRKQFFPKIHVFLLLVLCSQFKNCAISRLMESRPVKETCFQNKVNWCKYCFLFKVASMLSRGPLMKFVGRFFDTSSWTCCCFFSLDFNILTSGANIYQLVVAFTFFFFHPFLWQYGKYLKTALKEAIIPNTNFRWKPIHWRGKHTGHESCSFLL